MILDLFRLNGKVAVVTGANTGLGQGFCVAFAEAGATVIGVARRSCAETAAKVEAVGGTFFEVLTDLSAPDASKTVANACKKLTGRVDILVNNAGIIHREDAVNVTEANWDLVTNLNEKLVFFLSQAMTNEFFIPQGGGKIINIASMLSFQGGIRVPAYTSSKSAVIRPSRVSCFALNFLFIFNFPFLLLFSVGDTIQYGKSIAQILKNRNVFY